MERLKTEPVDARELQKVKNQNAASNFRQLQGNFFLMYSMLMREANRGWETINTDPPLYDTVTADDIMRVAGTYFEPENRTVAIYYRQASDEAPDPRLAGLDEEEQAQIRQMRGMIAQLDAAQVAQFIAQFEQASSQAPPENQDMVAVVLELLRERQAAAEEGGR
jgi:hypothetical protein